MAYSVAAHWASPKCSKLDGAHLICWLEDIQHLAIYLWPAHSFDFFFGYFNRGDARSHVDIACCSLQSTAACPERTTCWGVFDICMTPPKSQPTAWGFFFFFFLIDLRDKSTEAGCAVFWNSMCCTLLVTITICWWEGPVGCCTSLLWKPQHIAPVNLSWALNHDANGGLALDGLRSGYS